VKVSHPAGLDDMKEWKCRPYRELNFGCSVVQSIGSCYTKYSTVSVSEVPNSSAVGTSLKVMDVSVVLVGLYTVYVPPVFFICVLFAG
jgi:hypothetical protein